MKDIKYLAAYAIPLAAIIGLTLKGNWAFFTPVFAFVIVPILELLLPVRTENLDPTTAASKLTNPFFDFLLYLNIPLVYGMVGWFLWSLTWVDYSVYEIIGLTFSVGIAVGGNGINVAHELGHRNTRWEKTLAKILLIPSLYMHFYVEHNYGHHLNAATAEDPASAKYNQTVYSFWFTSMFRQYVSAWKIQLDLLKRSNSSFFSIQNDMLYYTIIQLSYLGLVLFFFGKAVLLVALGIGISSAILLETINYIEHYGLRRNKTKSGRYERVSEIHSWNSNHVMGRVMLYELTRHSDHHYKSAKKYQVLDYHDVSPQMPYGYPTSMLIALIPPLWFSIMNKRIPVEMRQ
ncbi:alkane 1-monooxygenase [Rasiella rasia]|uniref:Alkane 1-monooxygenase n=1 Tax=Rasiella rasia TaxID=2744027 RepID=A0A6G6GMY0_9FLAO|nr:alkane 1-monooxygenase [Rasiella rasia]QIE59898.1 alkane 1-monooxygenase [Rasiella rasia]